VVARISANTLTATDALARIAAGTLTAEELARACLDRVAERDGVVKAFAFVDAGRAIAEARERDRRAAGPRGLLHGLPIGVKDIIDTHDMPTEYGSPIYAGNRPRNEAACVALSREAGAVILGKTVTTEFALRHPGPTTNPHDPARTPGGSSSGSAAAVADFMVPVAFGTQTGGSIIRPASYCGIVGFKPSFNTINPTGVKPLATSFDTVGLLARSVDDCALVTGVLTGWASS
jgi:amidase